MKPWQYWLIFLLCFGVVLLAMGGISLMALSLDRQQTVAARQAAYEENVRLALWRMENALSPMLARESARLHSTYSSFYPAERAYTKLFEELGHSEVLLPSPLLSESTPNIFLHFQLDPDARITSPEVPVAKGREASIAAFDNGGVIERNAARLTTFKARIDRSRLRVEVLGQVPMKLAGSGKQVTATAKSDAAGRPADDTEVVPPEGLRTRAATVPGGSGSVPTALPIPAPAQAVPRQAAHQQITPDQSAQQAVQMAMPVLNAPPQVTARETAKNVSEGSNRSQLQQKALLNAAADRMGAEASSISPSAAKVGRAESFRAADDLVQLPQPIRAGGALAEAPAAKAETKVLAPSAKAAAPKERPRQGPVVVAQEGVMKPLWIGDMLLLARRVTEGGRDYVQGCWLDWVGIRKELLLQVQDLLPAAELVPAGGVERDMEGRLLAGLPLRLVPGRAPDTAINGMTPVRVALVIAWFCVLIGAGAIGVLLAGVVSLSERRAAFVSAVTHELRTPLTTFRMYAEMLAEDMVPDATTRKVYLATLCAEGNRLSHLVENVLAYARLERGRARGHIELTTAGDIIERLRSRLEQRTTQAGLSLDVEANGEAQAVQIRTDVSAVEQILFNLVDNACKYAASGDEKRIHLETTCAHGKLYLRVRDHGAGISADEARRLFKPFSKSAKHAAETAPGVGLGLALSRRLARQMKGDLRICPGVTAGACFELILPAVPVS